MSDNNYEKTFMVRLIALLEKQKSKTSINSDIKELEKVLNKIRLVATLAKGDTKTEINRVIKQMETQLKQIKLQAKLDNRQLNREIDNALKNVTAKQIQLNLDSGKFNAQVRRVISKAREYVDRNPLNLNINLKKEKLSNQLTTFLNKNTKISESTYWLNEADKLRTVINSITNRQQLRDATDQFNVFTSGVRATGYAALSTTDRIKNMLGKVVQVSNYFGLAYIAVNKFTESLSNLKEMDTILTEISKTTDLTIQQLQELGDKSYSIASKYGVLAKNFATSLQEMSRAGFGDGQEELLAELATLAQSAGALTSELVNDYIIASNAAYGYQGNVEKLNALLDAQNQVTNRNAVSMTELAEATKVAANQLSNSNISENEMTALLGTGIATTKEEGSVVGRAVKAIVMNLQQIKNTDEGLETTEEDLGKVERRLVSLGIQMKETANGITTLRSPIAILKELSDVYNSLPENSAERTNIISDIGGKYRGNVLSSILSNWTTYEKMLSDYENAEGSAMREAQKSADSWEGRLAQLQNSWDSFVNSLTNKNIIKGGISFLDNTIQSFEKLTDTIGAIPVLLTTVNTSMSVLNKDYGITQLFNGETGKVDIQGNFMGVDITAIKTQAKHFREASVAISRWNSELANGMTDINSFTNATVQNNEQLKAYLQTTSKDAPASLNGYKAYLNAAGVSTDALRLKTVLLTSVMSFGLSLAIQAVVTGISKLVNAEKEAVQTAQEAAQVYQKTSNSIDDYVAKYEELHQALLDAKGNEEETYNIKQQLLSLQTELNETFGEEAGRINLVSDAYKDQTETLKGLNKELANKYLNENRKGIEKANKEMDKDKTYHLGSIGGFVDADELDILEQIKAIAESNGIEFTGSGFEFEGNVNDASKAINSFMNDIKELQTESGKTSDIMSGIFDGLLDNSSEALGKVDSIIDEYGEIYDQAKMAQIATSTNLSKGYNEAISSIEAYNEAILRSEDPYNDENVKNAWDNLQSVKQAIHENEEEWGQYSNIMENVFASANDSVYSFYNMLKNDNSLSGFVEELHGLTDIDLQAMSNDGNTDAFDKLAEKAKEYGLEVQDVIDLLTELGVVQGMVAKESEKVDLYSSFDNTNFGERIHHANELFQEGELTHKQYFDSLQNEIENVDFTNFTDSIEDANKAAQQFFTDSVQQSVSGLSSLINSFGADEISVSEYLDGYLSIAKTIDSLTDELQENSAEWNKNGEAISDSTNTVLDETQVNLQNAMNVITEFQDSTYALEQIMSGSVEQTSDDFHAYTNLIAADLAGIVAAGGQMADDISSYMGTTTEEIADALLKDTSNFSIAEQAIAQNTNTAIQNMADSIATLLDNLGDAISNFKVDISFGVADDSASLWDAIRGKGELKFELGASGESLSAIGDAVSSFGSSISTNLAQQLVQSDDYHRGTTVGNSNYKPNTSVLDSYENALDSVKDSASSAQKEFSETIDFFEERVENLNDAISLLDKNIENVSGSFAKNKLVDAEIDLNAEKINNYSSALAMYSQKANEALAGIPMDLWDKVINGAVDLTTFVGDGNEAVVDAIKEYQTWSDKVAECNQQLAELQETIAQLSLIKFKNVAQDFTDQFDIRDSVKSNIDAYISLMEESGELVGESFYSAQIEQSKKQLEILEKEKISLSNELTSALMSGTIKQGSDEWLEMVNVLTELDGQIIDCKTSIEEFSNSILEIDTKIFERIQDQFSNINSELDNIVELMSNYDLVTDDGGFTNKGLVSLGALSQQYELAQYQLSQYQKEIDELNKAYAEGKYSTIEYSDRLAELVSGQWDCVDSIESVKDAMLDLHEQRIDKSIEGIKKEKDAYKELIDAQIESLNAEKELHDYKKSISDKTDEIEKLQREIDVMKLDTSASTTALRLKKEEELAKKLEELEELEYEHSIETQTDALNKQYKDFESEKDDEIKKLEESLEDREQIIADSLNTVKQNSNIIGQEIVNIANKHGVTISNAIVSSWQSGENAIASYGSVLSEQTSGFIGQLVGVENEVYDLQAQANWTATSLATMFGTRADGLINELVNSYYSIGNVNAVTNALQNSLINTLTSGYNVSGITSALNSIEVAARNAKAAIDAMNSTPPPAPKDDDTPTKKTGYTMNQNAQTGYYEIIDNTTGKVISTHRTQKAAESAYSKLPKYASGVHNLKKDELAWTQDGGGDEIILSPSRDAVLTPLKQGDSVLTKGQSELLYKWSKINPELFLANYTQPLYTPPEMPKIVQRNTQPTISVHYDKLVEFSGAVNDTKQFSKDISAMIDKANKQSWKEFTSTCKKLGAF